MLGRQKDIRQFFAAPTPAPTAIEVLDTDDDDVVTVSAPSSATRKRRAADAKPQFHPLPGFTIVYDVLTHAQETITLEEANKEKWNDTTYHRRMQLYGYGYGSRYGAVVASSALPKWSMKLVDACTAAGLPPNGAPDQVIVNEYLPGQGIGAHVDEKAGGAFVLGVSLGSTCVMKMQHTVYGAGSGGDSASSQCV
jgi:alkylated DNA repair dioxygenase AlkB